MSVFLKIVVVMFAVLLILGSACVTIAALFPPKDRKDGELLSKNKKES